MSWKLKTGEIVVDRQPSHIHPGARELLPEALSRISSNERERIKETIDFGRIIGTSTCVETQPNDEIVFAKRPDRPGLTRFVKNRSPEPTTKLTVKLSRKEDGTYELRTAYLGDAGVAEPWNADAKPESIRFWQNHALCWGHEEVEEGTQTSECPW